MAKTTLNGAKLKTPHLAGKEEIIASICSDLLKNPFFYYNQIFKIEDETQIGQSCFTTAYSPFFHKGVRRQSSFIENESRGLGFSKLMQDYFSEFKRIENFGLYYIQVHHKNYP